MFTYAILINPGYTRVSFQDSPTLMVNELTLAAMKLTTPVENIRHEEIGSVPYLLFSRNTIISEGEMIILSRLSFTYAIFLKESEMLKPLALNAQYFLNQEVSSILKYSGKTNELFTRLLLNMATFHLKNIETPLNILDPMAGKGTTLFESLIQGHNAYGIEIEPKTPQESAAYLKKYLETARYKHANHTEKTSGTSEFGKFTAQRWQIEIRSNQTRQFEIISGDTRNTSFFFKKNLFHAIVADLPYGVQHSSKSKKSQQTGFTRNALGLVQEAMPGWLKVLKPGGVIVLAWNLFLIPRREMAELLASHGLKITETTLDFSHRVDQAIDRDVIIAVQ